jgi:phage protein
MKKFFYITAIALSITLMGCSSQKNENTSKSEPVTEKSSEKEEYSVEDLFDKIAEKAGAVTTDTYNENDYPAYDYRTILRNPDSFVFKKMNVFNTKIIQLVEQGKYTQILALQGTENMYMFFIETDRMESNFLEGDTLTVDGRFALIYKYDSVGNGKKKVPLVYIDAYFLTKK